jgi:hypothetical protein
MLNAEASGTYTSQECYGDMVCEMGNQAAAGGYPRTMLRQPADAIFTGTRPLCALVPGPSLRSWLLRPLSSGVGAVKLKPQSFSRDDVRHGDRMRKCGGDSPTQALGIVKHPQLS